MEIFNYSPTGEYTYSEKAFESPLEKGVYIVHDNSTKTEPPNCAKNEVAIYREGVWHIEKDFRGFYRIDLGTKMLSVVEQIGEVAEGFELISDELAQDISNNPDKYDVVNGQIADISQSQAYKNKQAILRKEKWESKFIKTDLGWLRMDTSMGDLLSLLNSFHIIVSLNSKLEEGTLLFYRAPDFTQNLATEDILKLQQWNKEMSYEEFLYLFKQVSQEYLKKFKEV